jgi:hypothetical protein
VKVFSKKLCPCRGTRTGAGSRHAMPLATLTPTQNTANTLVLSSKKQFSHIKLPHQLKHHSTIPARPQSRTEPIVGSSQLTSHIPQKIFLQPEGPRSIQKQGYSQHGASATRTSRRTMTRREIFIFTDTLQFT